MDTQNKTRVVVGAAGIGAIVSGLVPPMLGYTNPYLGTVLVVVLVVCLVFILKPEWASIRLWGEKARVVPSTVEGNNEKRIGIDAENSSADLKDTTIRNQDVAIRAKNSDVKADNLKIK